MTWNNGRNIRVDMNFQRRSSGCLELKKKEATVALIRGPDWLSSHRESQRLSFTMAVRVLLGFRVSEEEMRHLFSTFQDFVDNLFSLPIDLPFSGYRKVRLLLFKAANFAKPVVDKC